jgi:hypothetical protein
MEEETIPSRAAFLAAPLEEVARVAPATLIYTPGGTRRRAALAGISIKSPEYARWTLERAVACFDLVFRHGVQHIFTLALASTAFRETGPQRERSIAWAAQFLGSPEILAEYARRGWRVRLLGAEAVPEFRAVAARLEAETARQSRHTLWWSLVPDTATFWTQLLGAVIGAQARTQAEAIRALYGEDIPPAGILLSFGKPAVTLDVLPPLLMGDTQCYWSQRAGYELDEPELRAILYDYAYVRRTWREDKSGREAQAGDYRAAWERGPVLGLGVRLGPFWYPAPTPPVNEAPGEV